MKKDSVLYIRSGALSILLGVAAVLLLPLIGTGFDFRLSISIGIAIGVFLGLTGGLSISIFMTIFAVAIAPTIYPRDMIFGILACGTQLLVTMLTLGLKSLIQKRRVHLHGEA